MTSLATQRRLAQTLPAPQRLSLFACRFMEMLLYALLPALPPVSFCLNEVMKLAT